MAKAATDFLTNPDLKVGVSQKAFVALAMIFFIQVKAHSQNLVINPSFEDTIQCPDFVSQIDYATNWHTSVNTPDYYNECNNTSLINPGMVGVPHSARGYQPARTGNAFAGVVIYWTQQTDYREIFYAQLSSPLTAGKKYNVGMFTVMDEDNAMWAVDGGLGIYLSASPINPVNPFIYSPQIKNPSGNVLNDTLNWTEISGLYIATGGEQYITIGSFIRDSALTIVNRGGTYPFTSYAIDDVWVIPDSAITSANEIIVSHNMNIFHNPSSGNLQIEFTSEKPSLAKMEVINLLGEILSEENISIHQGRNSYPEKLSTLNNGIYFLKITLKETIITKKFIIEN
jgi:hypothetical protein